MQFVLRPFLGLSQLCYLLTNEKRRERQLATSELDLPWCFSWLGTHELRSFVTTRPFIWLADWPWFESRAHIQRQRAACPREPRSSPCRPVCSKDLGHVHRYTRYLARNQINSRLDIDTCCSIETIENLANGYISRHSNELNEISYFVYFVCGLCARARVFWKLFFLQFCKRKDEGDKEEEEDDDDDGEE